MKGFAEVRVSKAQRAIKNYQTNSSWLSVVLDKHRCDKIKVLLGATHKFNILLDSSLCAFVNKYTKGEVS